MDEGLKPLPGKRSKKKRAPESPLRKFFLEHAKPLTAFLIASLLTGLAFWAFLAFRRAYYHDNPAFQVDPHAIELRGNTTLSKEMVLYAFGLNAPTNGFDVVRSDIVPTLRERMPVIKKVTMTYEPPKRLLLDVTERIPIARVAGVHPLLVDEEGVIFAYPPPYDSYPVITGFDLPNQAEPGARLPENLLCMLRLIAAANEPKYRLPSSIRRVALLDQDPEDGMDATLADGRIVRISWEDMSRPDAPQDGLYTRLLNLKRALGEPKLKGRKFFNAMHVRIAVSE